MTHTILKTQAQIRADISRARTRTAMAKMRQARRDQGEVSREVWAHPDDWKEIRETERRLREARQTGSNSNASRSCE